MTSPHGTVSRYTNGRCRCLPCRRANSEYRYNWRAGNRIRVFVPARSAREHLHFLLTSGWSERSLAKALDLDRCTIQAIAAGNQRRITKQTRDRILAAHTLEAPYREKGHGGPVAQWK